MVAHTHAVCGAALPAVRTSSDAAKRCPPPPPHPPPLPADDRALSTGGTWQRATRALVRAVLAGDQVEAKRLALLLSR